MKQYKVGDKVRIAKRIGGVDDYPFGYTDDMVRKFEGKIVTISNIKPNYHVESYKKFYNNDSTAYKIKEDTIQYDWHSSMFEPVNSESNSDQHLPNVGAKITVGNFTGELNKGIYNGKWYLFFDKSINNNEDHEKICKFLHGNIDGFFKLAEAFGSRTHSLTTCFPGFESLENLLKFVEELNIRLADKASLGIVNKSQTIQKNENRFQKPKASIVGGSVPEGRKISGRKNKTAISSGCLSYRVCDF